MKVVRSGVMKSSSSGYRAFGTSGLNADAMLCLTSARDCPNVIASGLLVIPSNGTKSHSIALASLLGSRTPCLQLRVHGNGPPGWLHEKSCFFLTARHELMEGPGVACPARFA